MAAFAAPLVLFLPPQELGAVRTRAVKADWQREFLVPPETSLGAAVEAALRWAPRLSVLQPKCNSQHSCAARGAPGCCCGGGSAAGATPQCAARCATAHVRRPAQLRMPADTCRGATGACRDRLGLVHRGHAPCSC